MNEITEEQLAREKRSAEKMAEKAIDVLQKRAPTDPEAADILKKKGVAEDRGD